MLEPVSLTLGLFLLGGFLKHKTGVLTNPTLLAQPPDDDGVKDARPSSLREHIIVRTVGGTKIEPSIVIHVWLIQMALDVFQRWIIIVHGL